MGLGAYRRNKLDAGTRWTWSWPCGSGNDPLDQKNGSQGRVWR